MARDKNERVRRKAMAALGEYLFYVATQMDEEQDQMVWSIPQSHIVTLSNKLKTGEDDIVRHYATKTIENICCQSKLAAKKMAI